MKNQKNKSSVKKGFTLIELVVVIGILAVLLTIVLIAINPGKQLKAANDTKRRSDVNAILNAVTQYAAENGGQLPPHGIGTSFANIVGTSTPSLCSDIVPNYIAALPIDPEKVSNNVDQTICGTDTNTWYQILQDSVTKRVTVSAPLANPVISITR